MRALLKKAYAPVRCDRENNIMNRSSMQKQMMSAGGKLNMVKGKDGKMVPDYAADGKGKMKAGGMAKAYKDGGEVKKPRRAMEAPMSDERAKEAIAALKMDKKSKADKKSKNKPAKKMMAGGMTNKPKAKVRGYGMARGGKVCKMR